jgi:hypothetical protein
LSSKSLVSGESITSILNQVEETSRHLTPEEQLLLIEQLAHRLREDLVKSNILENITFENKLAEMAADPEIQVELQKVNQEFAATETDGL